MTLAEVCEALKISRRTMMDWLAEGCPRTESKRGGSSKHEFDLYAVLQWRIEREVARRTDGGSDEIARLRLRQEIAKTEQVEAESALVSGSAVALADVEERWSQIVSVSRNRLLGVAAKVATRLAGESSVDACRDIVDVAIRDALIELSNGIQIDGEGDEAALEFNGLEPVDVGASAEPKRKPVGGRRAKAKQ